ncbi:hypothetical protein BGZ73_007066 [Actinomortierella ambigua]|nr:hypothetical protein BGZ73_007066 [Actinomortierella ambigua]
MNSDTLTLLCLVDGETAFKAFSVKVPLTDNVGDLKNLIMARKIEDSKHIDTSNIRLWHVAHPAIATRSNCHYCNVNTPVHLRDIESKTELDSTDNIADVFTEVPPKETIHIIVQRLPPQVQVPARTRPSTLRPKAVSCAHIDQEMEAILNALQYCPMAPTVDPLEAEAAQRKILGPFFKRTLPYVDTATDIKLVMLGLELNKQATAGDGKTTLPSIVENDVGRLKHSTVAMVAPSGSGKTTSIVDLATKHFVVYFVCRCSRTTDSPELQDPNFIQLALEVEEMYETILRAPGVSSNVLDIESKAQRLAKQRVELEVLARLLFLQLQLNKKPDLEPQQFFREQICNAGAATIRRLVDILRVYDTSTIQDMLASVQNKLHTFLGPRHQGLVIALDEAQVAAEDILASKFILPSALAPYWNTPNSTSVLFDDKNEIPNHLRRGFLNPLLGTLSLRRATLVILGTTLSLLDDVSESIKVGEESSFFRITDFPVFDANDVQQVLSGLIDSSGCEIPFSKRRMLSGRARLSFGIVSNLIATGSS